VQIAEDATNVYLSARNIAGATVMSASAINTYDLVNDKQSCYDKRCRKTS